MMDLGFHLSSDDLDVSMDMILFVYHQELLENFEFYAGLNDQFYGNYKNFGITWQAMIHWLRTFDIVSTREEAVAICSQALQEVCFVKLPFQDTLNIRNTFTYVQFMEAHLRIGYFKKQQSEAKGEPITYKDIMNKIFTHFQIT